MPHHCTDGNLATQCRTKEARATGVIQHWTLDLGVVHRIDFIQFLIRPEDKFERFQNVKVFVYNETGSFSETTASLCDWIVSEPVWGDYGGVKFYNSTGCIDLHARFIRVQMNGSHEDAYLHMKEVMVYGKGTEREREWQ